MYKVNIFKTIWIDSEKTEIHKVLSKTLSIPFAPYPGLNICSGKFQSGPIVSVTWNCKREEFHTIAEDEFPWEDHTVQLLSCDMIESHFVRRVGWEVPADDA